MIQEYQFSKMIEGCRQYKAYVSCLLGEVSEDYTCSAVETIYEYFVEAFIDATINPALSSHFEACETAENGDDDINAFNMLNDFINYGYAYTIELQPAPQDLNDDWYRQPVALLEKEGILLDNIHDFYNYWVLFKNPENPIYKDYSFSSEDSTKLAKHYIGEIRKQYFSDKYFII